MATNSNNLANWNKKDELENIIEELELKIIFLQSELEKMDDEIIQLESQLKEC